MGWCGPSLRVCVLGEWGIESAGNFSFDTLALTPEREGETKLGAKQRSRQELIERENGRLQRGRLGNDDFGLFRRHRHHRPRG